MTRVPKTQEDLTPEWLTEALHESGVLEACAYVTACEFKEVGTGRGFAGVRLRGRLSYEPAGAGPASFVVKLPRVLEQVSEEDLGLFAWIYSTEINFYRHLAGRCPVRVPLHYWSGFEPDDGSYCLLIEDMGDPRVVSQLSSCGVRDAYLVVSRLARLSARWWCDEQLAAQEWVQSPDVSGQLWEGLYVRSWEHFWALLGEDLPADYEAPGRALVGRIAELVEDGSHSAWTLVHGDYRLENFLFDDDHEDPLVVLDWQTVSRGSGLRDLGYFIGQSLTSELRRVHEPELLRRYHQELQEHGVSDYPLEQMMRDYRRGLLLATAYVVNNARMLSEQQERGFDYLEPEQRKIVIDSLESGRKLMCEMATRNVSAVYDNAALDLI